MRILHRFLFLPIVFLCVFEVSAQIPAGYYDAAAGLTGTALKNKLHDIISTGYIQGTYADLWTSYQTTDVRTDGKVWDMYSDIPGGTAPYLFTFVTDQCGSYSAEGDCYNREHSVPESWFSGASPMYSDLFHIVPTDGYVNNRRSNYPFGDVASATWTSQNGSKLGTSAVSGYTGTVFEPIDSFKGDFARIYFYMATRYKDEISSWSGDPFTGSDLTTWAKNMFLQWDSMDPVSAKEITRNNKAYSIQNNRNPYVDHPEWVNAVWGPSSGINNVENNVSITVFPNPVSNIAHINLNRSLNKPYKLSLLKTDGSNIFTKYVTSRENEIDFSALPDGVYFISIKSESFIKVEKIVVLK
jgi:endonuclease I